MWRGVSYQPEGVLKLGQGGPGLELAVLQVAQGVLKSPLAEAGRHVTQTHKIAGTVGCEHPRPRFRSSQLSWKGRRNYSI